MSTGYSYDQWKLDSAEDEDSRRYPNTEPFTVRPFSWLEGRGCCGEDQCRCEPREIEEDIKW